MDSLRALALFAVAVCLLGRIEYSPTFVPTTAGQRAPALAHGRHGSAAHAMPAMATSSLSTGFVAAAAAAVGAAGLAAQRRRQVAASPARTQVKADTSGLTPTGPVVAYAEALMNAGVQQKEPVKVTKDVMMIRDKFDDEDFLDKLQPIQNEFSSTMIEKAKETAKILAPFESTVMEKFIIFLAKKKRLAALKPICKEYIASLYFEQSIAPVTVSSAQKLTDDQVDKIKEKMKEKTGFNDIKLVQKVDPSLLAGFVVEWGYTDPENLVSPSEGIDLSMKRFLEKKAIDKGVPVQL